MTDSELMKNHILFHAYFCYLIDNDQEISAEELCEISIQLSKEINRRKIGELQIQECVKNIKFDPHDQLMISKYIYPNLLEYVGQS